MSIIGISLLLPIGAVVAQVDPLFSLYNGPNNIGLNVLYIAIRYTLCQWACLEGSRVFCLILTYHMQTTASTMRIVATILSEKSLKKALEMYRNVQVIIGSGREALRRYNAIIVFLGCFLMIIFNYLIVKCYSEMPLAMYINTVISDLIIAVIIHMTLPMAVDLYESTMDVRKYKWAKELLRIRPLLLVSRFKELQRIIQSQRPVTYYYGSNIFEMSTKQNIYRNILDQTISLVMM